MMIHTCSLLIFIVDKKSFSSKCSVFKGNAVVLDIDNDTEVIDLSIAAYISVNESPPSKLEAIFPATS